MNSPRPPLDARCSDQLVAAKPRTGSAWRARRLIDAELNAVPRQRAISLGGSLAHPDPEEAARADQTDQGSIARRWGLWPRKAPAPRRGVGAGR